jgi:hypothetical protein
LEQNLQRARLARTSTKSSDKISRSLGH